MTVGTNVVVSGLTVPANGYAQLIYQVRVNEFAPVAVGGEIVNTVTATVGSENATAQETITVAQTPILGITKGINPTTVSENGQLTYTFTVQNLGNTPATVGDNLIITDVFDPALDPITVTYNGTLWTAGVEYNYDPTSGLFTTVGGNITVPAATYVQDPATGEWNVTPGTATLIVTGTV